MPLNHSEKPFVLCPSSGTCAVLLSSFTEAILNRHAAISWPEDVMTGWEPQRPRPTFEAGETMIEDVTRRGSSFPISELGSGVLRLHAHGRAVFLKILCETKPKRECNFFSPLCRISNERN